MGTDEELLAAIRAAPHDDAPRLVYADHLLESDDPRMRERGEFIIAQCATARLLKRSAEWRRARARELALQRSVAEKPKDQRWSVFEWRRGFPSGVTCSPAPLRKAWKELAALPIDRLALYSSSQHRAKVTLGDIAWAAKRLPQLESVLITGRHVSATLATKHLGALDEKATAVGISTWPHHDLHRAITALMIEGEGPGHMDHERFPSLEQLSLRSPGVSTYTWGWARSLLLKRLTLHRDGDERHFGRDLAFLRTFSILERLSANVRLDRELSSALSSSALEELELHYDATDAGLSEFVAPPALRRLTFYFSGGGWHNLTPETAKYRLPAGEYSQLESLELGRFVIDASFGELNFPSLHQLKLVECIVEPSGITALAKLDGLFRPEFLRCRIADEAALRERWPDVIITK